MSAAPRISGNMKFKVYIQRGPLSGQSFNFEKDVVQIGRGPENDLVLSNDLRASRLHAEIRWDGTDLQIVNISNKNFLAVNGQQVEDAILESGTIILIGETEMRLEFEQGRHHEEPKTKVLFSENEDQVVIEMPAVQSPRPGPLQPSVAPVVSPVNSYPQPPAVPPSLGIVGGAAGGVAPYNTNIPGNKGRPKAARPRTPAGGGNAKLRFYAVVAVIGLIFAWLMTSNNNKKKELTFRSTDQIEKDIEASREELKTYEARRERLDNVQFKRAQENYIRGFRDYKQGNYGRARESFQVVLNLDPDNELAKRYYQLSRLKFDEMVKFHMLQGNRYREKKNWRMCKSSYFNVMTMVNNNQDPVFKEAKQYYDQCSLAQEGRY